MRKTMLFLALIFALPLWAHQWIAADLKWSSDRPTYLGLVNRAGSELRLSVEGYAADGSSLGRLDVVLGAFQKVESATDLLFGSQLAWARIEAEATVVGYVRYVRGKALSLVPLSRLAGPDLYLPAISANGTGSEVVVVNTAAEGAHVLSSPKRAYPHDFNAVSLGEPAALTDLATGHSQLRSAYSDLLLGEKQGLLWDRLRADLPIAGVQHFYQPNVKEFGSLPLQLTSPHALFFVPLKPASNGTKTHLVLVNTTAGRLRATLTLFDAYLPAPSVVELDLQPGEKRTYTLGDPTQLPQFQPIWGKVETDADGLISYQYSVNTRGERGGFLNPSLEPAVRTVLPYLRQDGQITTRLTLINPVERNSNYEIRGFDERGVLIRSFESPVFRPAESRTYTMTELFGNRASNISWLEVRAMSGKVAALALISSTDAATLGAFALTPVLMGGDERVISSLEFPVATELTPQPWTGIRFDDQIDRLLFNQSEIFDDGYTIPQPGRFFTDCHFIASAGKWYLGYEPLCIAENNVIVEPQEEIALVSPYFEVPTYEAHYLSFDLRLIDPDSATAGSRYGLVWREEGSEDWQWFGLNGEILLDPPTRISDCWERVCYRTNEREAWLTPWFQFETVLPETVRGKRIQVGLFYNHVHLRNSAHFGPTIFIDNVRLRSGPLAHPLFFPEAAGPVRPATAIDPEATSEP